MHLVAEKERPRADLHAVAIPMQIPMHASDYPDRVGVFASDAFGNRRREIRREISSPTVSYADLVPAVFLIFRKDSN
jgi:hypothetical protein